MKLDRFYKILDSIQPDEYGCHNYPRGYSKHGGHRMESITGQGERYVHRLTLVRKLGRPIKRGFLACHHCDNPVCVNPDHIYEGTPKQNIGDSHQRYPVGVRLPSRKRSR